MYPEIATTFLPTIEGPDDPTCQMAKREDYGVPSCNCRNLKEASSFLLRAVDV
jgi:fructose/tagatose bisphosphate aldolase